MTAVYFQIGLSGRDACMACRTLHDLISAAEQLAPGQYWIEEMYRVEGCSDPLPLDWGTLEIDDPSNWCLRTFPHRWGGPGIVIMRSEGLLHRLR